MKYLTKDFFIQLQEWSCSGAALAIQTVLRWVSLMGQDGIWTFGKMN